MSDYLLVRHASAESGLAEAPLTPGGRAEASALARRLRNRPFDAAWGSDLARATETAKILLEGRKAPNLATSPLLREVGPPPEGLLSGDPAGYEVWERETVAGLAAALRRWIAMVEDAASLLAPPAGEREGGPEKERENTILVVSHAGPLRVLICLLLGLPPEAHWSFCLDRASLSVVRRGKDMGTILLLNDRCHLDGLASVAEIRDAAPGRHPSGADPRLWNARFP